MTAKKVLIAYATAGIGHKKAALAVEEALKDYTGQIEVKTIDVLDYSNALFKKAYPNVYLFLIGRLVYFWGFLYYLFDIKAVHNFTVWARKLYHIGNCGALAGFLNEYKPDVIVSTHFVMPDVAAYARKKYKLQFRVINIVTDYRAHAFWISDGVDNYVVAHEDTKKDLTLKWGIDENLVKVMGIPIEPKFSKEHDRHFYRTKLNIPQGNFTVLLLSGGFGVGPMYEIVARLVPVKDKLSVIVVCGHNKQVFEQIESFKSRSDMNIINFGFVNTIDELMAASDLYVGKAGGISTAEGLAMWLPLVFIRPIPGQESRNADFVVKNKAGRKVKDIDEIIDIIKDLKETKEHINALKQGVKEIQKKNASRDIAAFVMQSFRKAKE